MYYFSYLHLNTLFLQIIDLLAMCKFILCIVYSEQIECLLVCVLSILQPFNDIAKPVKHA